MLPDYRQLHVASSHHETDIKVSKKCGCFYCKSIFEPERISAWIDEPPNDEGTICKTALCPICGIDSVLPDTIPVTLDRQLLNEMHKVWF